MPRRHISKIRSRSAFRRRPGQREPRSITPIVCEGKTERAYFEAARIHFQLTTAEVVVADNTKGAAPISVVECAEERAAEQGGYDTIFCVFDRDGHESFDRARAKIRGLASRSRNRLNMHETLSVPCFELWVLLHFGRTDRPFRQCAEVIGRIRSEHMNGYEKANDHVTRRRPNTCANNIRMLMVIWSARYVSADCLSDWTTAETISRPSNFYPHLHGDTTKTTSPCAPIHSAMFQYVNGSMQTLPEVLRELVTNELAVLLAQTDMTIYFTKLHIADLQEVIRVEHAETAAASARTRWRWVNNRDWRRNSRMMPVNRS